MTRPVPRKKTDIVRMTYPSSRVASTGQSTGSASAETIGESTSILWKSAGNPVNRETGKRESGGPFHVTHSGFFVEPGSVKDIVFGRSRDQIYSGPCIGAFVSAPGIESNFRKTVGDKDTSDLDADGATAIARVAPTNPTAKLSVTLAETMREGIPSLVGIDSWKRKTNAAKDAGSDYLSYQFGWSPLVSEVTNVVNAARNHRDIMHNYRHNEGKNVHRRFDFPDEIQEWSVENAPQNAISGPGFRFSQSPDLPPAQCVTYVRNVRKRWFEGCFTYGGPGKADNYAKHLGFGNEADAVYGLNLSPDVLWEAAPWSWAVDWFTNAGDVIHNVSSFAAAGLVMRYGYMMEETTSSYYTNYGGSGWLYWINPKSGKMGHKREGSCSIGKRTISRTRGPANPFGFGVGWEGLSPTQLAVTAAIGITRFL